MQFDPQVLLASTVLGSPKGAYTAELVSQQEQAKKTLLANPLWQKTDPKTIEIVTTLGYYLCGLDITSPKSSN